MGEDFRDMAEDAGKSELRPRRRRKKSKGKDRKREKLMNNPKWVLGSAAVGLPPLALLIWLASKF